MTAGIRAGRKCRPGYRRLRGIGCLNARIPTLLAELRQVRQVARLEHPLNNFGFEPVEPDNDDFFHVSFLKAPGPVILLTRARLTLAITYARRFQTTALVFCGRLEGHRTLQIGWRLNCGGRLRLFRKVSNCLSDQIDKPAPPDQQEADYGSQDRNQRQDLIRPGIEQKQGVELRDDC